MENYNGCEFCKKKKQKKEEHVKGDKKILVAPTCVKYIFEGCYKTNTNTYKDTIQTGTRNYLEMHF